jgi:hypothetical protein
MSIKLRAGDSMVGQGQQRTVHQASMSAQASFGEPSRMKFVALKDKENSNDGNAFYNASRSCIG